VSQSMQETSADNGALAEIPSKSADMQTQELDSGCQFLSSISPSDIDSTKGAIVSEQDNSTPVARRRGRPKIKHNAHDRCNSWNGTPRSRSCTKTPDITYFMKETGKRKQPSGTPPKDSDNKVCRPDSNGVT
jgi:hypothetical protein